MKFTSLYRRIIKGIPTGRAHQPGLSDRFAAEFKQFESLSRVSEPRFAIRWEERQQCSADQTSTTNFDRHYVYHLAWAARMVKGITPPVHVDISSSLYFSTILSAFVPTRFYDYRPAHIELDNLSSEPADLLSLPFASGSIGCLSCMHVVEHIGLGRYGDRIDPDGDLKAIAELKRVLAPGGSLLFVVPIGKPKVVFNAHRIYSYAQIEACFKQFELREFALIPDNPEDGGLVRFAPPECADRQSYGCGCFLFQRPKAS